MQIHNYISSLRAGKRKALALLIDPDETRAEDLPDLFQKIGNAQVDVFLVGGSLLIEDHFSRLVTALKSLTDVPVVLFPGSIFQVHPDADAILFLSLISGRNPEMLIGNHVLAAPSVRRSGLEVIPTGYMLIDSGNRTSVHYMSGTSPIPWDKPDIAACTALAGELLGLKLIYMDGGSGANRPVSSKMVRAVASQTNLPLIVGGGIRTAKQADEIYRAGADLIVIGTAVEEDGGHRLLEEISAITAIFQV